MIFRAVILLTTLFLAGCSASARKDVNAASFAIESGMSQSDLMMVMSEYPAQRTFKGRGTAIQFCSGTGLATKYVVVWLVDDAVEGLTQYQLDTRYMTCDSSWREIDWGQAPADVKIKLDID